MNRKKVLFVRLQRLMAKMEQKTYADLSNALLKVKETEVDTATPHQKKTSSQGQSLTEQVETFLKVHYDFRYNVLTEETEYRQAGKNKLVFAPVSQRVLNSLCLEAHDKGILCWDRDLSRYVYSTRIAEYHPFNLYMKELPAWDGTDRLKELARRVSASPLWIKSFHTWMLGMSAQWMGITDIHANSVAPLLVSTQQGFQKSTFCKSLMPPALQRYYVDKVDLMGQSSHIERRLAETGLLNLDEFDKYPASRMPLLKNLMQTSSLNLCKAYQKNFRSLPRIASFIGTSNRKDLLTDPTGSRRFVCVEVEWPIDCTQLDHSQIYAQLKSELLSGARYWFSKEEEGELQKNNADFYRQTPVEDVLCACFRSAQEGEDCSLLSAADIFQKLKKFNPAAMRGANPMQFASVLVAAGMERKHTKTGNKYKVIAIHSDEEQE